MNVIDQSPVKLYTRHKINVLIMIIVTFIKFKFYLPGYEGPDKPTLIINKVVTKL